MLALLILSQTAFAAERTVSNMYCEACPYMVVARIGDFRPEFALGGGPIHSYACESLSNRLSGTGNVHAFNQSNKIKGGILSRLGLFALRAGAGRLVRVSWRVEAGAVSHGLGARVWHRSYA